MEQILDFLKHFSPTTTPAELVSEYFKAYQKGNWKLTYDTHGGSRTATKNRARVKVIKGCKCEVCGFSNPHALDVHHVRPVSEGGTDEIENLACLCKNCHGLVHYSINTKDLSGVRGVFTRRQYSRFKSIVHYRRW